MPKVICVGNAHGFRYEAVLNIIDLHVHVQLLLTLHDFGHLLTNLSISINQ